MKAHQSVDHGRDKAPQLDAVDVGEQQGHPRRELRMTKDDFCDLHFDVVEWRSLHGGLTFARCCRPIGRRRRGQRRRRWRHGGQVFARIEALAFQALTQQAPSAVVDLALEHFFVFAEGPRRSTHGFFTHELARGGSEKGQEGVDGGHARLHGAGGFFLRPLDEEIQG